MGYGTTRTLERVAAAIGMLDGAPIEGSIAGRLWTRLAPGPHPEHAAGVLNAFLVLLADHELATSTLAARVAASTRATPPAPTMCVVPSPNRNSTVP